MAAEDAAADTADVVAEADCADVNADDTEAVGCDADVDCQLMSSSQSDASALVGVELLASSVGCAGQNAGGDCSQLSANAHELIDRHVNECAAVADDSVAAAAMPTSADVELLASAASNDCVQVPADAHHADVHDEPPPLAEAAVPNDLPNEPQPAVAADAEVVEPVGNIIPPPLAVLAPQGLGDVHQAMMQGGGPVGFQPYKHPNLFALRVIISLC